ncbi:MAG: SARP family transcriptional regulator [Peptococcaceae bacterium]|nr:SARP family transcriptional regulator [Peptococcaceae bacterium]
MQQRLQISMLGGFSLSYPDGTAIDYQSNRSNKLWMVLAYLLTHRGKQITQDELIDILWPDEEIDNPVNTLKTMRHRLCGMLDALGGIPGKEMIRYNHGIYAWSEEVDCVLDIDQFSTYCALAEQEQDDSQKISYYLNALEYYNGDFLPKLSSEMWVMSAHAYYHAEYLRVVKKCIALLRTENRYYEIITVCQKAVTIEPYDEDLHRELIDALVRTGAKQSALDHYEKVKELFYHEFGINLSEDLVELYKQIIDETNDAQMDLSFIASRLQEDMVPGAFYCEYALFKEIYRLMTRMMERSGQSAYLCLVSVTDKNGKWIVNTKKQNEAVGRLRTAIQFSLRRGDVFTRYSVSQYLILLSSINYENTEMVLRRITDNFKRDNPNLAVKLVTSNQPIVIPLS